MPPDAPVINSVTLARICCTERITLPDTDVSTVSPLILTPVPEITVMVSPDTRTPVPLTTETTAPDVLTANLPDASIVAVCVAV